jgi:hypothetical protein
MALPPVWLAGPWWRYPNLTSHMAHLYFPYTILLQFRSTFYGYILCKNCGLWCNSAWKRMSRSCERMAVVLISMKFCMNASSFEVHVSWLALLMADGRKSLAGMSLGTGTHTSEFYLCGVHPIALYHTYTSQIFPQSQVRFLLLFYSVRLQHISASTGHLQVKYNIIYIFSKCHRYHNRSIVLQLFTHVVWVSYCLFIIYVMVIEF